MLRLKDRGIFLWSFSYLHSDYRCYWQNFFQHLHTIVSGNSISSTAYSVVTPMKPRWYSGVTPMQPYETLLHTSWIPAGFPVSKPYYPYARYMPSSYPICLWCLSYVINRTTLVNHSSIISWRTLRPSSSEDRSPTVIPEFRRSCTSVGSSVVAPSSVPVSHYC